LGHMIKVHVTRTSPWSLQGALDSDIQSSKKPPVVVEGA
jgi:hypothetical protein